MNKKNHSRYINGRTNKTYYCKEEGCNNEISYQTWKYGQRRCESCAAKTQIGSKSHAWKGGKKRSFHGYILIFSPNHPFAQNTGYILEHRLVMEKKIGRYLTKEEVVHHINGAKDDNRIENLMLFPNSHAHISFIHLDKKTFICKQIVWLLA